MDKKDSEFKIISGEEFQGTDCIQKASLEITETLLNKFPDLASAPGVHITIILNVLNQAFANITLLIENKQRKQLVKMFHQTLIKQLDLYEKKENVNRNI